MTSTIKVDNVQNQPGTNIVSKCGTDVTIGASGDTIALACGASQTGFGRTGTVDWDTSIKTGTVTAVTGKGYFVNTTSGGITVNLPAAAVGSIVAVSDYASTSASNNITIAPNGSEKINGVNDDFAISTAGLAVTLVYADATRGWKSVTGSDEDATGLAAAYVAASGGNTTITCGDYKVHVFTGPGTFCVSNAGNSKGSDTADYLVVAGGAGGGAGSTCNPAGDSGGGGGAGGMQYSISTVPAGHPIASPTGIAVPVAPYSIVVGAGGAAQPSNTTRGNVGNVSSFSTIPSAGGGSGGGASDTPLAGGSGGGGSGGGGVPAGGAGDTPPTTPAQGFPGGAGAAPAPGGPYSPDRAGGAGGGSATIGGSVTGGGNTGNASGGNGAYVPGPWFGPTSPSYGQSPVPLAPNGRYFSGGAAGSSPQGCGAPYGGVGGAGGGGGNCSPCNPGTVNTGGGGAANPAGQAGSAGGSGIVVIRYKFQ
jgi:hypothetical protein